MKKLISALVILTIFSACSKEEKKLELFSGEAFAFTLEEGWELNASVQVKGFSLKENENYTADLTYFVDLITPEADTIKEADYGEITEHFDEEVSDLPVDIQIELDAGFSPGGYKLLINVTDVFNGQTARTVQGFELTQE